jgi:hypothetical protein
MLEDKPEDAQIWKERGDKKPKTADDYERTFECRLARESELEGLLKRGGKIIVDALSRYWAVAHEINNNPELALELLKSEVNYTYALDYRDSTGVNTSGREEIVVRTKNPMPKPFIC